MVVSLVIFFYWLPLEVHAITALENTRIHQQCQLLCIEKEPESLKEKCHRQCKRAIINRLKMHPNLSDWQRNVILNVGIEKKKKKKKN